MRIKKPVIVLLALAVIFGARSSAMAVSCSAFCVTNLGPGMTGTCAPAGGCAGGTISLPDAVDCVAPAFCCCVPPVFGGKGGGVKILINGVMVDSIRWTGTDGAPGNIGAVDSSGANFWKGTALPAGSVQPMQCN